MNRRQLLGTAFVAPFIPMEQGGEVIEPWKQAYMQDPDEFVKTRPIVTQGTTTPVWNEPLLRQIVNSY